MTRSREWLHAWLLLLPAMALLALFTHYPAVANLWHSFYSTPRAARPAVFVGMDNYRTLVDDPIFWKALTNNLIYAAGTIPVSVALALLMAVWVNGRIPRQAPSCDGLLHADGAADDRGREYLAVLLHARVRPARADAQEPSAASHNWLGSTQSTALGCLMVVTVWKEAGFFMIFYLAALQAHLARPQGGRRHRGRLALHFFPPRDLAASAPATLFILVNAVINAFRPVDHIFVMTGGGPDNATIVLFYIYEIGFNFWDSCYAAALTMVLLAMLGTLPWRIIS